MEIFTYKDYIGYQKYFNKKDNILIEKKEKGYLASSTYTIDLYEYLKDESFLKKLDSLHIRENTIKITILDWQENPIDNIEGCAESAGVRINFMKS